MAGKPSTPLAEEFLCTNCLIDEIIRIGTEEAYKKTKLIRVDKIPRAVASFNGRSLCLKCFIEDME